MKATSALSALFIDNRWAPTLSVASLVLFILLVAPPYLYSVAPAVTVQPVDHRGLVDGIYRVSEGQIPYIDFRSVIGALIFYVPVWLSKIPTVTEANALNLSILVFGLLAAAITSFMSSTRFPAAAAFALTITVGFFASTTSYLEITKPIYVSGLGLQYNRVSEALCVAGALAMLPRRRPVGRLVIKSEALLLGLVFASLFFIKITAFAVFAILLASAAAINKEMRISSIVSLILGAIIVGVITLTSTEMIANYLDAIIETANSGGTRSVFHRMWQAKYFVFGHLTAILVFCALAYKELQKPGRWKYIELLSIIYICAIINFTSSFSSLGITRFMLVIPFIIWAILSLFKLKREAIIFGITTLVYVLPFNGGWLESIRFSYDALDDNRYITVGNGFARYNTRPGIPFAAHAFHPGDEQELSKLHRLLFRDLDPLNGDMRMIEHQKITEDGVDLLRRFRQQNDLHPLKVDTIYFVNPFPAEMNWPPPSGRGLHIFKDVGQHLNPTYHQPAKEVSADTDIIMMHRYALPYFQYEQYLEIYGGYIAANYVPGPQSRFWQVLKRGSGQDDKIYELFDQLIERQHQRDWLIFERDYIPAGSPILDLFPELAEHFPIEDVVK